MSKIELMNIDKYYGDNHVLKDLSLTIEDGDFMTLLGPSGCGKTTMLRIIAGLEKPQNGRVLIDGHEVINSDTAYFEDPGKRGLNLVFQSYALWPHMTVYENIAFGLKIKKLPRAEVEEQVMKSLAMMRIDEYAKRYPNELSGGQQQRVAISRAIASSPKLLLLDEPLSNLDAKLRIDMRAELKRLHRDMGTTIIYVTHDQVEALTMSTRIALFKEGEISQVDTPMNLYMNPTDLVAADFIGNPRINFLNGTAWLKNGLLNASCDICTYSFSKKEMSDAEIPQGEFPCVFGIRPEQVQIETEPHEGLIEAEVYASQPAGSETLVTLVSGTHEFLSKQLGLIEYEMNQKVYLRLNPDKFNVFEKAGGKLIKYAV